LFEPFQRKGAGLSGDLLSVIEYYGCGDAADAKPFGDLGRVVRVELAHQRLPLNVSSERIHGWCHHPTRPTPVGVEIHSDGDIAFVDGAREGVIVQQDRALEQNRLAALSTFWPVGDFAGVDPVPGIAELAAYGKLPSRCFCFCLHPHLRSGWVSAMTGIQLQNSNK
jgi:hypothetical protein